MHAVTRSPRPPVTSQRMRIGVSVVLAVASVAAMSAASRIVRLSAVPATEHAQRVVVFGIPHLGLGDLDSGAMPTLDRLVDEGAMAAASVRTYGSRPTSVEAYSTMSAGTRVRGVATAALAFPADTPVEDSTAADVIERRLGARPSGEIVLPDGPRAIAEAGTDVSSVPGALGTALADDGRTTAVVGNADQISPAGLPVIDRPAAIGGMRDDSSVDTGAVGAGLLVRRPVGSLRRARRRPQPSWPRPERAIASADLVILDPGDTDRASAYGHLSARAPGRGAAPGRAPCHRRHPARRGRRTFPTGTLLLVIGMTPPTGAWELTPLVAHGAGVVPGHLHSDSTKRPDLVTLTDVSTTILSALDVPVPSGMIGQPLRVPRRASVGARTSSGPTRWRSDESASTTRWR